MRTVLKAARKWSVSIFSFIVLLFIVTPLSVTAGGIGAGALVMTAMLKNLWRKLTGGPHIDELPKYTFWNTIEEFGYQFNDKGELLDKDGGRFKFLVKEDDMNYNQQHYEALGELVTEYLYTKMETELKLKRVCVPVDAKKDDPQSFIFTSEDALKSPNLMVIIHGSGAVRAGQWSRKLIMNENIDTGSQLPYIRRAMADGYGVIVMNTNLNTAMVNGKEREIRGNANPKDHGVYVWENFVRPAEAKNIAVVAHSFGGIVTCTIAEKYLEDFKNRVFCVAFTDSVHCAERSLWTGPVKEFMKQRAVNFASTYVPIKCMMDSSSPDDCLSVSAGTEEHERTSHSCIDIAFQFIRDNFATWTKDKTMAPRNFLPLPEDLSPYSPAKRWERMYAKAEPADPDQKPLQKGEEEEGAALKNDAAPERESGIKEAEEAETRKTGHAAEDGGVETEAKPEAKKEEEVKAELKQDEEEKGKKEDGKVEDKPEVTTEANQCVKKEETEPVDENTDDKKTDDEMVDEKTDDKKVDEKTDDKKVDEKTDDKKVDERTDDKKVDEKTDDKKVDEKTADEKVDERTDDKKVDETTDDKKTDDEKVDEKPDDKKTDDKKADEKTDAEQK